MALSTNKLMHTTDEIDNSVIDIRESTDRHSVPLQYKPPGLIKTPTQESKEEESNPLTASGTTSYGRNASLVCINQIPLLNVLDLTKRSANLAKVRQGRPLDDLEYQDCADSGIEQADLAVIEKEVNKKKRRKYKEAKTGGMLSPGSECGRRNT